MKDTGMFGRVLMAVLLAAAMGASVAAQSYNAIGSGGPLWWFPANDGSYSRHHDRWYMSHFESLDDDWTVATSFPTILGEVVWVSAVSEAPENSACDRQNGTELDNVGPPYPDDGVRPPRTSRTPDGIGGFAGLQMSMHISEWWQGMKYLGYLMDPTARAEHFSGSRAFYDSNVFGWFDVRMKDGAGAVQRPPLHDGGHSVMWINPMHLHWRLWGGGGFSMPCLGISMVQMHGVDGGGGEKVWPPMPVGADGGECWSNARPMVLRANSEARCEPNLAERYPYTARFWTGFDAALPRTAPAWIDGSSYLPLFPPDYSGPYVMARRGEVAVFTASELAEASPPAVPWSNLSYPDPGVRAGMTRSAMPSRFLDPNRVDPFGGASFGAGTMSLPLQDNPDPNLRECIEMGEAGWDAATGTLNVDCAHGRENSPMTGRVNRAVLGYGAVERSLEAGPMDNSRGHGGQALARRHAGLWAPPAGFGWFEHRYATLGCLFLEADVAYDRAARPGSGYFGAFGLAYDAEQARLDWVEEMDDQNALFILELSRGNWVDALVARVWGRRAFRIAYGWEIIRDYRVAYLPEMVDALGGAEPYGYAAPRQVLLATGRRLGHGGNACVTSMGGTGYNEFLVKTSQLDAQGQMWHGSVGFRTRGLNSAVRDRDARGAHAPGDWGDPFGQFSDVVGRTTPYSEAELPSGVDYPAELRRSSDYNNGRTGSTVWRDFACFTAINDYYGMGTEAVGPGTLSHREDPNDAWRARDGRLGTSRAGYPSGTPCDPAVLDVLRRIRPQSPGMPLSEWLSSFGSARDLDDLIRRNPPGGLSPSEQAEWRRNGAPYWTRGCFELLEMDPAGSAPAGLPNPDGRRDRFTGGRDSYSQAWSPTADAAYYRLEYSGDGSSDAGRAGSVGTIRPASYRMLEGSEVFELDLRSGFFNRLLGYRSLDIERLSIWWGYGSWSNSQNSSWLRSGEEFDGTSPGWCAGGTCDQRLAPKDWGRLEHEGQLRSFGAMVIGGTGGCTLDIDGGAAVDGKPPQGSVMLSNQRIVCLLPTGSGPDGRCPGENLP